jgi:hypothetical protein
MLNWLLRTAAKLLVLLAIARVALMLLPNGGNLNLPSPMDLFKDPMAFAKQIGDQAKKSFAQAQIDLGNAGRAMDQRRLEEEDKAKKLANKLSPPGFKPFGG